MGANGTIDKKISKPNKYGVYRAEVTIWGNKRLKPNTFFPDDWTPQQVLDAIDEAYYNGAKNSRNQIIYTLDSGMEITVNLNKYGKIVSAYPVY